MSWQFINKQLANLNDLGKGYLKNYLIPHVEIGIGMVCACVEHFSFQVIAPGCDNLHSRRCFLISEV